MDPVTTSAEQKVRNYRLRDIVPLLEAAGIEVEIVDHSLARWANPATGALMEAVEIDQSIIAQGS